MAVEIITAYEWMNTLLNIVYEDDPIGKQLNCLSPAINPSYPCPWRHAQHESKWEESQ